VDNYKNIKRVESLTTIPVIGLMAKPEASTDLFVDTILRVGGMPQLIDPDDGRAPTEIVAEIAGLLIGGESDLDPLRCQRAGDEGLVRELFELSLLKVAMHTDLPVLGICRGMQALNVALGGSVTTNSELEKTHGIESSGGSALHRIFITPGSKLAAIVGSGGIVRVNSRHRQCVTEQHKAGKLLASAYALDDGVIEGLESPEHQWIIGVQFHPERRLEIPPHFERLFQSFVERSAHNS
jgi:putative glutamine amidotransferase